MRKLTVKPNGILLNLLSQGNATSWLQVTKRCNDSRATVGGVEVLLQEVHETLQVGHGAVRSIRAAMPKQEYGQLGCSLVG